MYLIFSNYVCVLVSNPYPDGGRIKRVLLYGLDLLLKGFNMSFIYLHDYSDKSVKTFKDDSSWFNALDYIRNDTVGTSGGHMSERWPSV